MLPTLARTPIVPKIWNGLKDLRAATGDVKHSSSRLPRVRADQEGRAVAALIEV